jgi:hypothetical protein
MEFVLTNGRLTQNAAPPSDIIHHALTLPGAALRYHIGEELAQRFAHKALLETNDSDFDVEGFAEAGRCMLTPNPALYNQFVTSWFQHEQKQERRARNGWFSVTWQGEQLELLLLEDHAGCCTAAWLLADTRELAERFFAAVCAWSYEVEEEVLVFERNHWSKHDDLYRAIRGATRAALVLPPELEQALFDDVTSFFAARDTYIRYGVPWKRGIILIGPPGNGKTHAVKALVNSLALPCLYVKSIATEHDNEHLNIKRVFDKARATAPCVLVLEDLDSLLTPDNRAYFLNELDGFAGNEGILTLATTNYPEKLDPSILERPSRFDRKYHFGLPALPERLRYLQRWNDNLSAELRLSEGGLLGAAEATETFSFAYLKELMLAATMAWIATPDASAMDAIVAAQAELLRAQMSTTSAALTQEAGEANPAALA